MVSKAKSTRQQLRRPVQREPYKRMLIVCEGQTEKHYFDNARQALKLPRGRAKVITGRGSDPMNIVETAKNLRAKARNEGNAFDLIYCVFDKDKHPHYSKAIEQAKELKMETITSVPCFEYWVLLHFDDDATPYEDCDSCINKAVKKVYPDYEKNQAGLYAHLRGSRLDTAKQRADKRLKAAKMEESDNPSTNIHRLLNAIEELKTSDSIQSNNEPQLPRKPPQSP